MKTIIYIDGFNLYYRLKNTPYKWLNLQQLCQTYLNCKQHNIIKIKYFTALVKGKSKDHSNIHRQHRYLQALKTISNLEIIFGQFKKRQMTGIRLYYEKGRYVESDEIVTINKWEEKESEGGSLFSRATTRFRGALPPLDPPLFRRRRPDPHNS